MNLAIFDVDGTLLDNQASEDLCYVAALRDALELPHVDTDWRTYQHVSDEGIAVEAHARAFGVNPSRAQLSRTTDRFVTLLLQAHASEPLVPVAGAAELLLALPKLGWTVALATGAWERAARFKLDAARLPIEECVLATAEDGPARTAIVRAAWERARARLGTEGHPSNSFDRVVLIGDGVWDVATARALDLPFVGRAFGSHAETLRGVNADTIVEDFSQLHVVLTALESA